MTVATPAPVVDDFLAMLSRIAPPPAAEDLSRYRADPVAYALERLGVKFLPHQACLAYAIANRWDLITPEMAELAQMANPGKRKIAVRSGQKTGKSKTIICLALWFFECFAESRAFMTAAIGDQIRSVLWKELFDTLRKAPHAPVEKPSEDPTRGMLSADRSREIKGFTGRTIESVAGISGNLAYFVDEASHLEKPKYEALKGNTAGEGDLGAPILFTSQATRNEGPFFEAFHSKAEEWTTMVFDAEAIADYQAKHGLAIKGMATKARVAEWKAEEGEDSPFYQLRVKGAFLKNETGRIVTMHLIEAARARWREVADGEDVLSIGFDPAGPGDGGDELGFAPVRGPKCVELYTRRGLDEEAGLKEVYHLLEKHRRPGETPRIMIDAEGMIGSAYYGRLRAEAANRRIHSPATAFDVYGVRTSSRFVNDPTKFARVRDEVWWNLAQWMLTGAIPLDHKLEAELHAPTWLPLPDGKIRATPKSELRDFLGRSPDRADALGLAVDPPRVFRVIRSAGGAPAPAPAEANAWGYGGVAAAEGSADPNAWGYER